MGAIKPKHDRGTGAKEPAHAPCTQKRTLHAHEGFERQRTPKRRLLPWAIAIANFRGRDTRTGADSANYAR